ncbi:MAG: hypothetical protein DLD55_04215 [candidate division SR1 bacterium]|nr:MAG: hypothetical protein DLD55_04215 [candidate division SR1 bacterium]
MRCKRQKTKDLKLGEIEREKSSTLSEDSFFFFLSTKLSKVRERDQESIRLSKDFGLAPMLQSLKQKGGLEQSKD